MILHAIVVAAAFSGASVHLPVSTTVPQAQSAFDRGLFLYYAYNGDDAARAFTQAAELDRHLAMTYWGIALADGPDLNTPMTQDRFVTGAAAIRKAAPLEAAASPLERRFIESMELRYRGTFADWATDDAAYSRSMLAFAESAENEDARLLAAEALLEHGGLAWHDGRLASDESQEALRLVSSVLQVDPASIMANHLCIHLYDLAPHRDPALACTQRLDALSFPPEAEHLAHMPAHYWVETGNYAAAIRSSEHACALMTELAAKDPESLHVQRYARHDASVGYSAAMMLGNYAVAQRWGERMNATFGTSFDALTALRFGRLQGADAAAPDEFASASVHGLAALQLGQVDDARAMAARVRRTNSTQGYLPQLFLARLAESDGNYDEAERWIQQSLTDQIATFGGELLPFVPAGEALGELRLRHGDAKGAIEAFSATLDAYPDDPRAQFGLSQALAADGQDADAAAARTRFEKEWKGADTDVRDALP